MKASYISLNIYSWDSRSSVIVAGGSCGVSPRGKYYLASREDTWGLSEVVKGVGNSTEDLKYNVKNVYVAVCPHPRKKYVSVSQGLLGRSNVQRGKQQPHNIV